MNNLFYTLCLLFLSFQINFIQACELSVDSTEVGNGAILLTATSPDSSILEIYWSTGEFGDQIIVQIAGTYCATLITVDSCVVTTCLTIDSIPNNNDPCFAVLELFPIDSTLQLCGQLITPFGIPIIGDSYLWNTGDTSACIPYTPGQDYCVTITSSIGTCEGVACWDANNDFCEAYINYNPFDNEMHVIPIGIAPYTYLWNTGETTADISTLVGETYCVTVTDASSCEVSTCMTADSIHWPDSLCYTYIDVVGNDVSQVILTAEFDFPQQNLQYLWNTGDSSQSIVVDVIVDSFTTYCVTVTAPSGCSSSACINLMDFTDCGLTVLCDPWGPLEVFPTGLAPYTYLWNTGSTESYIEVPIAGETYCVTVTDALSCVVDTCLTIPMNPVDSFCLATIEISADSVNGLTLTAYDLFFNDPNLFTYVWSTGDTTQSIPANNVGIYCVTMTNVQSGCESQTCIVLDNDLCDAEIEYNPFENEMYVYSVGLPPFTYLWNTGETTADISTLAGETYCVTVTDASLCEVSTCMTADSIPWPDSFCYTYIDVSAYDSGQVVLFADFDFPQQNLQYLWNTGETTESIVIDSFTTYCVTVTAPNSCSSSACVDLLDFLDCGIEVWCDPWGPLEVFPTGFAPYTYIWNTGSTESFIEVPVAGETYCVTVTDALDCVVDTCLTIPMNPIDTFCIAGIVTSVDSLNGFTLTAYDLISNSDPNLFTYVWNTGDSSQSIVVNSPGFYCVTMTNIQDGCVSQTCIDLSNANNCNLFAWRDDFGGLNVIGTGIAPFAYQWDNGSTESHLDSVQVGETYCVTVTDALDCVIDTCITIYEDSFCYVHIIQQSIDSGFIQLVAITNGVANFVWSTGDTSNAILVNAVDSLTDYCVTASFGNCEATACASPFINFTFPLSYVVNDPDSTLDLHVFNAVATLYKFDNQSDAYVEIRTMGITGGINNSVFEFPNVDIGEYLLKIEIVELYDRWGQLVDNPYLPTYYVDAPMWDLAEPIYMGDFAPNPTVYVHMIKTTDLTGPGSASGYVLNSGGFFSNEDRSTALEDVVVILTDENGQPLTYTISAFDGSYNFVNLPYGTYRLYVDIINGPVNYLEIIISPTDENPSKNILVYADEILSKTEDLIDENLIQVYPNPMSNQLIIKTQKDFKIEAVELISMDGRKFNFEMTTNNTIEVKDLQSGLYVIRISTDAGVYMRRLVKM